MTLAHPGTLAHNLSESWFIQCDGAILGWYKRGDSRFVQWEQPREPTDCSAEPTSEGYQFTRPQ